MYIPNAIKEFTERRLDITFLDEYFQEQLASAEYGYMVYQPSSSVTKITVKVGRVGLAIGRRGRTIKKISQEVKDMMDDENIQIEVEGLDNPEIYPQVMAARLASSLERGRHFRRSAYGTMRRIMSIGALGCEITVSGKITSQRARVENFREGYVAKTGEPAEKFVRKGYSTAKIKRGTLGITVLIMMPDSRLPDDVEIIEEPSYTSREIIKAEEEIDEEALELDEEEEFEDEEFGDLEDLEELEEVETEEEDDDIPEEAMEALDEEEDLDLEELEEVEEEEDEE